MSLSQKEIHDFISRFEDLQLPKSEWTHQGHLVAAIWYCSNFSAEEALKQLRNNITAHNSAVGTPNTDNEGYHETITAFWVLLATYFIGQNKNLSMEATCNDFISWQFSKSNTPLQYYSENLLYSKAARRGWVNPDLQTLDFSLLK